MRLIGMLDSPYVRRVAVSMRYMGLPFAHEPVSVFRHFEQFAAINPIVRAPTLVCDDGTVLMESTLILEYLEHLAQPDRRLGTTDAHQFARHQRIVGLALSGCEKTVQLFYERTLRPAEKQHQPWAGRVQQQALAAYRMLDAEIGTQQGWLFGARPLQADITAAVAWNFSKFVVPDTATPATFPALEAFTQRAERQPEFLAAPMT